jgi:molecular chaperone DnaK
LAGIGDDRRSMGKEFLKVGIDHGTSNSSVCIMEGDRPRVIKVNGVDEIMPSVVYIDRRGRVIIGAPAYRAMLANAPDEGDGYTGYKLRIGQDDQYDFRAARVKKSARQLGSLVMGELLRACREDTQEDAAGAVITVPAQFEHSACEGTCEAARLAGLKFYPLVSEPVSAAAAYGFTARDRQTRLLIFDMGSGTLDISLVSVKEGRLDVPAEGHAGDNLLGGRKFDREILAYVLQELKKQYALGGFQQDNPKYRQAFGKLLLACELARIQLSNRPEAVAEIDGVLCKDDKGRDVRVGVPLTRAGYSRMIAGDMAKAVQLCKTLLQKNRMKPGDLTRLILIGEATKNPLVQEALADGLGIDVKPSIDPTTAVAIGAAIYATTIEVPEEFRTSRPGPTEANSPVKVLVEYQRTPKTSPCYVAGTVEVQGGGQNDGLSVEVIRKDGRFTTGPVPVGPDGTFMVEVALIDEGVPKLSRFSTRILDQQGKILASVPEPEFLFPCPLVVARLANSLLIGTIHNEAVRLVEKGASLYPVRARGVESFKTTKLVKRGSSDAIVCLPILEGVTNLFGEENDAADLCFQIGVLEIRGDDSRVIRDIPAGTSIEITIEVDSSHVVQCTAYIELLDQEFSGRITREGYSIDLKAIQEHFERAKAELQGIEDLQRQFPTPGVDERLHRIRELDVTTDITKELERAAQGETEAFSRAHRRVLELAGALRMIADAQLQARIDRDLQRLGKLAKDDEAKDLAAVEQQYQALHPPADRRRPEDARGLRNVEKGLMDIDRRVRRRPLILLDWYTDIIFKRTGGRVNLHQKEVYERAIKLFNDLIKTWENPSTQDLAKANHMVERELFEAFPELGTWIQEARAEGPGPVKERGGVERKTDSTHVY